MPNDVNLENVQLTGLTDRDSAAMLSLINHIQPNVPWTLEHLRWQFFETPAGPARLYGIKNSAGNLVAFYAAVSLQIQVKKQLFFARMIQDVMTHPDYRGRGFLHYLANVCLQDMKKNGEFGFTLPNEKSEKSFRRNNWTELCVVPWRKKTLEVANIHQPISSLHMTSVDGLFDESVSEIWASSGISVGVHRDAKYLNWRYSKPNTKYFKFLVNANQGYLVLKFFDDGKTQTLHICDLVVKANNRSLLPSILEFCEQYASNRASTITAWLDPAHPYAEDFDRKDLRITPSSRFVFVLPSFLNQDLDFSNSAKWHLSQGDSDVY